VPVDSPQRGVTSGATALTAGVRTVSATVTGGHSDSGTGFGSGSPVPVELDVCALWSTRVDRRLRANRSFTV